MLGECKRKELLYSALFGRRGSLGMHMIYHICINILQGVGIFNKKSHRGGWSRLHQRKDAPTKKPEEEVAAGTHVQRCKTNHNIFQWYIIYHIPCLLNICISSFRCGCAQGISPHNVGCVDIYFVPDFLGFKLHFHFQNGNLLREFNHFFFYIHKHLNLLSFPTAFLFRL
jgi:hypothetical protein